MTLRSRFDSASAWRGGVSLFEGRSQGFWSLPAVDARSYAPGREVFRRGELRCGGGGLSAWFYLWKSGGVQDKAGRPGGRGEEGGVLMSCMAVVAWLQSLASLQCRDGACRVVTDQASVVWAERGGREGRGGDAA